jgi:hypothetical protein
MAINEWWKELSRDERYWVEITDRETLGENLWIPKFDRNGNETPSYTCVSLVQPGDVVFHWCTHSGDCCAHPDGESAFMGLSVAEGKAEDSRIDWQPHGPAGKRPGNWRDRDAWFVPLRSYQDFPTPVTLEDLRRKERELRRIRDHLAKKVGSTYFPFVFSNKQPLRPAQGYLFKLPAAVVDLFPELRNAVGSTNPPRRA